MILVMTSPVLDIGWQFIGRHTDLGLSRNDLELLKSLLNHY